MLGISALTSSPPPSPGDTVALGRVTLQRLRRRLPPPCGNTVSVGGVTVLRLRDRLHRRTGPTSVIPVSPADKIGAAKALVAAISVLPADEVGATKGALSSLSSASSTSSSSATVAMEAGVLLRFTPRSLARLILRNFRSIANVSLTDFGGGQTSLELAAPYIALRHKTS